LIYGTRVSLLLAPAAAVMSTLIAGVFGGFAGLVGGWSERLILAAADLSMALPLLFVLLALRSVLPLDISPVLSVVATFILLGLLGWPHRYASSGPLHEIFGTRTFSFWHMQPDVAAGE